jgi:hypothetical protein
MCGSIPEARARARSWHHIAYSIQMLANLISTRPHHLPYRDKTVLHLDVHLGRMCDRQMYAYRVRSPDDLVHEPKSITQNKYRNYKPG